MQLPGAAAAAASASAASLATSTTALHVTPSTHESLAQSGSMGAPMHAPSSWYVQAASLGTGVGSSLHPAISSADNDARRAARAVSTGRSGLERRKDATR